jgi:hypothetical protein
MTNDPKLKELFDVLIAMQGDYPSSIAIVGDHIVVAGINDMDGLPELSFGRISDALRIFERAKESVALRRHGSLVDALSDFHFLDWGCPRWFRMGA